MTLKNKLLLLLATVSAGLGWILIPSQSQLVLTEFSIAYRFAMAGIFLFLLAILFKKTSKISFKHHLWMMLIGFLMYGLFCSFSYRAAFYLPTGLISLFIACMVIPNMLFDTLFLKKKITLHFYILTAFTLIGMVLVFWNDVSLLYEQEWKGVLFSIASVLVYSFASFLFTKANFQKIPKIQIASTSMIYAATLSLLAAFFISGEPTLQFDFSQKYILSLLGLGLYFSPIVLVIYLYLIDEIGASKASYIWVGMPLVALNISSIYEGFVWDFSSVIGVILVVSGLLLGNKKFN
jgi:drug/metabolite transporter (DMT)-like permease